MRRHLGAAVRHREQPRSRHRRDRRGSHTNQAHICSVGGKLVTSAASFGRLVTAIDLKIDEKTGQVDTMQGRNVIATRDVSKDVDQTTIITKYDALSAPLANRVVGSITADLLKLPNAAGESSMGDAIADSQLAATKVSGGAVAAFTNIGGVRAEFSRSPRASRTRGTPRPIASR